MATRRRPSATKALALYRRQKVARPSTGRLTKIAGARRLKHKEFQNIMSKFLLSLVIVATTLSVGVAQNQTENPNDPPSRGVAPKTENGIGRADVRVVDEHGNPVSDALVKLESNRSDGFFCESWDNTDAHGITVLPPIHMGTLKLIVKAKGFKKQEIEVPANSLGDPIRVTLRSK